MIKNNWYAVLNSNSVKKNQVVGVTRLNKKLAFFRDSKGKLNCVMDVCAHRGAALSKGEVKDDCIKCPFHGIEYNQNGECQIVPSEGISSEQDFSRFNLVHFHVREIHDIIYFWYGDSEPIGEPDTFDEIADMEYSELVDHWNVHYSRIIENQLDVTHLAFIHHNTIGRGNKTLANGPKTIWLDDNTLQTSANNEVDHGQKPLPNSKAKIKSTNLTFKFPNTWLNTIHPKMRVLAYFVPVDEENSLFCIRFYNKMTGFKPIDKFISFIGKYGNLIVERQDKRVVQTQLPKKTSLKMNENLVQGDMPIIEYRRKRQALIDQAK